MTGWAALEDELEAWSEIPGGATFWWRDDDLTRSGPQAERLAALSNAMAIPLLLAVIPHAMDTSIAQVAGPALWFAQHGWAHADHSLPPEPGKRRKKIELGGDYAQASLEADLRQGWGRLSALPADRLLQVLVPPWNRIEPRVVAALPALGYVGLSGSGPRRDNGPLRIVNVHVDVIDWRGTGGFVGEAAALTQVLEHLSARRRGTVDSTEPTGLMTHHAVHDAATWAFVAGLLEAVASHPHASWLSPGKLFDEAAA